MQRKKIYPLTGINNDDDLRLISETEYLNLQNGRIGISEYGKAARLENVAGTTLVTQSVLPPYGTHFCIGSCIDGQRNYLIYALYNTFNDHGIYAYDPSTGTTYAVIYDSQVVGGLDFSKSYPINRNMYVIGDMLYWTDNNNEPKSINYIAGIKSNQSSFVTDVEPYYFPIKYQSSTLIVRPPIYVLTATKQTDSGVTNNFISLNSFQFTYQYVFVNNQYSALADYSLLVPANFSSDTYNNILVKVPFAEFIDNEVQQVNLIAKYGNNGKSFIVKSWNKENTQDANEIFSHNLGNVQLQYQFYNNVVGTAVDDVTSVTQFSNVPLKSKTLVPARDRLFLANNTLGYDTPMATSSLSVTTGSSGADTTIFKSGGTIKLSIQFFDRFKRKCGAVVTSVKVVIPYRTYTQSTFVNAINWALSNTNAVDEIPDWAYYYQILWSKNLNTSYFIQGMVQEMYYAQKDNDGVYTFTETQFNKNTTAALAVNLSTFNAFGIGYSYSEGDLAVLYRYTDTNYYLKVLGQYGNYALLSPTDVGTLINNYSFTLLPFSYLNAADTAYLPANADNPVTSGDITVQSAPAAGLNPDPPTLGDTNFIINNSTLATRTFTVTGTATYTITGTSITIPNLVFRVAITNPPASGATYVDLFSQSAVPGTYTNSFSVTVTVPAGYNKITLIGLFPDVVTVTLISGSLNFTQAGALNLVELYTPNQENVNEQYYGYGSVYNVTNPGEITRTYSTTSGTIIGDSFRPSRTINTSTIYYPEAMSPNDLVYQLWERSLSFSNVVDYIGQQVKKSSIAFSDTFINGTKVNGLCSFQPLNQKDIGVSSGQIQKIVLTNKKQEDGTVMLVLTDNETVSIYLGETQVVASSKNTFISVSDGVIGTINTLRGNSGTVNPEGVVQYLGNVYWPDANNGYISQYSPNGIDFISSYKMSRFFQRYFKNYLAASTGNLDNINGFHHISLMVDPFHKRIMVVLPALIYQNYATILPSYSTTPSYATSIINRTDAYDSLGKTMCFDYIENRWKESFEFLPEWSDTLQDKLYGFKNGILYIHDNDTANYNNFYGTNYPVRIAIVPNTVPSEIEDIFDISIEGTAAPDYSFAYTTYPNVQITDLTSSDYEDLEGVFYARFLRDRLSPSVSGTVDDKLISGDVVKSATPIIWAEWQQYTALFYANFINIGMSDSRGQKQLINK